MKSFLVLIILVANTCGANWRIIGGEDAKDGQFPFIVSLRKQGKHACGGSIVSDKFILTAAHCVVGSDPSLMSVLVGTNKLSEGGKIYRVKDKYTHEDYDAFQVKNDIALVKLTEPITFTEKIQPIQLETEYVGENKTVILSGWGSISYPGGEAPDKLQQIDLIVENLKTCQSKNKHNIDDTQICAKGIKHFGACHGDSGGPLIGTNKKQVGIVSYGHPCAAGYPDVFTRVSKYMWWIKSYVKLP